MPRRKTFGGVHGLDVMLMRSSLETLEARAGTRLLGSFPTVTNANIISSMQLE
jgi:hypothetical protein